MASKFFKNSIAKYFSENLKKLEQSKEIAVCFWAHVILSIIAVCTWYFKNQVIWNKVGPHGFLFSWNNTLSIRQFLRGKIVNCDIKPTDGTTIFACLRTVETSGID